MSVVSSRIEAFRQGMRELGYVEGANVIMEWRSAEGKIERRTEIAADLVRLKPDIIVSAGPSVTRALKSNFDHTNRQSSSPRSSSWLSI